MKNMYQANEELATIFLNNGFIDTTSESDKKKGKMEFRINKNAHKRYILIIKISE